MKTLNYFENVIDVKRSEKEIGELGQEFIDNFKFKVKKAVDEVLGNAYVELMPHIEGDSWVNYREYLKDGLGSDFVKNDFRKEYQISLRRKIFLENKEELVNLLNQDLVKRVNYLEDKLKESYERYF